MSCFDREITAMLDRQAAMLWVLENIGSNGWPAYLEGCRTGRLFGGWRFVDCLPSREIVFTNMIDPPITIEQVSACEDAMTTGMVSQ